MDLPSAEQLETWADLYWKDPEAAKEIEDKLTGSFPQKLRSIVDLLEHRFLDDEAE